MIELVARYSLRTQVIREDRPDDWVTEIGQPAGNCSGRQRRAPCVPWREGAPPSMPASSDCMPPHLNSSVHPTAEINCMMRATHSSIDPVRQNSARDEDENKPRNACEMTDGSKHIYYNENNVCFEFHECIIAYRDPQCKLCC